MADTKRPRGAPGPPILAVMLLVSIVNFIDRQLPAILAEDIKRDLGLSDTQLGLLTGVAFALVYTLAAIPLARLADRWSARNVLVIAVGFWSVMTALGAAARSFLPLALTRTGVALGEAASTPSTHAIICRLFPSGARGEALGIVSMGAPIGTMLGMMGGGLLSDALGWRAALMIAGAVGCVIALATWLIVPDIRSIDEDDASATGRSTIGSLLGNPAFAWMAGAMCLYGLAAYPFLAFTAAFFMRVHGLTAGDAGLALGLLQGVMGLVGTLLGGWLFDRSIRRRTGGLLSLPALSLIVSAPLTGAAWLVSDTYTSIILLIPFALAITFYAPALFGAAHIVAGRGGEATASSLMMIAAGFIGGTAGPLIVGMVSDRLAPQFGTTSLRWALLQVPLLAATAGAVLLIAERRVQAFLSGTR